MKKILILLALPLLLGASCGQKTTPPTIQTPPAEQVADNSNVNEVVKEIVEEELDIFADQDSFKLDDVTGGRASGEAWLFVQDNTTYHRVIAKDMPPLQNDDFYEGWLVKSTPTLDFFSTGNMIFDETSQTWLLEYKTTGDKSDYSTAIITLEPNDGDPAPAAHIIEGTK